MKETPATAKPEKKGGVKTCTCDHKFQDARYGKGQRVFNPGKTEAHCTVCGAGR
jgi:hypothetical protein